MSTQVTIDICLIRLITGIEGNIRHCNIPHTPWELCCILGLCVNKLLRQMCFYKINNCFTKSYLELISWGFLFATRLVTYFWKELIFVPSGYHFCLINISEMLWYILCFWTTADPEILVYIYIYIYYCHKYFMWLAWNANWQRNWPNVRNF